SRSDCFKIHCCYPYAYHSTYWYCESLERSAEGNCDKCKGRIPKWFDQRIARDREICSELNDRSYQVWCIHCSYYFCDFAGYFWFAQRVEYDREDTGRKGVWSFYRF